MLATNDRNGKRSGAWLALAALALLAGGCKSDTLATYPTDYRDRHPIRIVERPRAIELFIGTGRGGLTATQRAQVAAFGGNWRREGNGYLTIHLPAGTPNEAASKATVREVRSLLQSAGVPAKAIDIRAYRPADPITVGVTRLSFPVTRGEAGPCGMWPHDIGVSAGSNYYENWEYWNLGCATQRNLAAAVVDPSDLVQPRPEDRPYAARRQVVLDKYRQGQDTATNYQRSTEGRVSNVGASQ